MATTKKPASPQSIYQLHVALLDFKPVIWRRLWMPANLKDVNTTNARIRNLR